MTARDRIVALVVGAVALLGAFWFLALSPKRKDAADLGAKITAAQQRLDTARQSVATAHAPPRSATTSTTRRSRKLGKAVPADDDVASLVYQLNHVSQRRAHRLPLDQAEQLRRVRAGRRARRRPGRRGRLGRRQRLVLALVVDEHVELHDPAAVAAPAAGVPATQSAAAGLPPGSTVGSAGFPTMPFSFVFDGSFFNMEHFFSGIQRFATVERRQTSRSAGAC